jgi:hypothetical protein
MALSQRPMISSVVKAVGVFANQLASLVVWRTTNPCLYRPSDPARALPTRRANFDVAHFRFCREGGGQQISPENRIGGVGIAVGVTRRPRGALRGSRGDRAALGAGLPTPSAFARPTGLPRSLQPQVSEVFVLAKLTPNEGDLSVKHFGGVRRPAPSAGAFQGGVQPKNCATSKRANEGAGGASSARRPRYFPLACAAGWCFRS